MSNQIRTPVWLREVARSKRLHIQSALAYLAKLNALDSLERDECLREIAQLEREAEALEIEATQLEQQP